MYRRAKALCVVHHATATGRRVEASIRWWPATTDGRRCRDVHGSWGVWWTALDGGESSDAGGDGYESTGETALFAGGGVILMCRFVCGCDREYDGGGAWLNGPDE